MSTEEFKQFIESIGFKFNSHNIFYEYKEYRICLYTGCYHFHDGSEWIVDIPLNNLRSIENYFKQELRSIKLKQILK